MLRFFDAHLNMTLFKAEKLNWSNKRLYLSFVIEITLFNCDFWKNLKTINRRLKIYHVYRPWPWFLSKPRFESRLRLLYHKMLTRWISTIPRGTTGTVCLVSVCLSVQP